MNPAKVIHAIIIIFSLCILPPQHSHACGPEFPNAMLLEGDKYLLNAPIASFSAELSRLRPEIKPEFTAVNSTKDACWSSECMSIQSYHIPKDKDLGDLEQCLTNMQYSKIEIQNLLTSYSNARKSIEEYRNAKKQRNKALKEISLYKKNCWIITEAKKEEWSKTGINLDSAKAPHLEIPVLPHKIPLEFSLYLKGAAYYHKGENEQAASCWEQILKLPKAQRQYRSTWATFMMGKIYIGTEPDKAIELLVTTRRFAHDGFADSLGLAASSYGWEALIALRQKKYMEAIMLYLRQLHTGDASAIGSLKTTIKMSLNDKQFDVSAFATAPACRKVFTAYLLSRSQTNGLDKIWLRAIEKSGIKNTEDADWFCWLAYQAGEIELCQRWLKLCRPANLTARWIHSKLLLREGNVREGMNLLAELSRSFQKSHKSGAGLIPYRWDSKELEINPASAQIQAELGIIQLSREEYIQSLDTLLKGNYWLDVAYIAEDVLSTQELASYIDTNCPVELMHQAENDAGAFEYNAYSQTDIRIKLRYLLARRLAREGQFKEATTYYPLNCVKKIQEFRQHLNDGKNIRLGRYKRIAAIWNAAVICRYHGMELFGTELEPDWFFCGGSFSLVPFTENRKAGNKAKTIATAGNTEFKRTSMRNAPEKRFHYRYTALELAWRAAELMPDNDPMTARMLMYSGYWVKDRSPQDADKFYKALVRRCGNTTLGKDADKQRWFPIVETAGRPELILAKEIATRQ